MAEETNIQNNESNKNKIDNENKEDNSNMPQPKVNFLTKAKPQSESQVDISQLNQVEQKHPTDDINPCCQDCIRWDKYREKCFYWWRGKRYCSRRVISMEDLEQENLFLG